jgi:azurin
MEAVDKSVEHDEGLVSKDDPRVIAFTPMCDKGTSVMIQFTAPGPGDYPFFCSTPGHGECMNGILHVERT